MLSAEGGTHLSAAPAHTWPGHRGRGRCTCPRPAGQRARPSTSADGSAHAAAPVQPAPRSLCCTAQQEVRTVPGLRISRPAATSLLIPQAGLYGLQQGCHRNQCEMAAVGPRPPECFGTLINSLIGTFSRATKRDITSTDHASATPSCTVCDLPQALWQGTQQRDPA